MGQLPTAILYSPALVKVISMESDEPVGQVMVEINGMICSRLTKTEPYFAVRFAL